MATLPASYPGIPYLGAIPGGLYHGLMIRINGEMLHHDRFNVELKAGPILQPSDDVNLHLSVRPNEQAIVRNHMVRQSWGPEERLGGCPIGYGQQFEILILAEAEQYKVAVNGRHFCEFRHRIPLSSARFIYVSGNVKIFSIKLEGDPSTVSPSAPVLTAMTTSALSYQPPSQPYNQSYQSPPYSQFQPQPGPYGSMSSTMNAVPANTQPTYPSGQYYPPQQTYYYEPQQTLSAQPYQQYPSYHAYQQSTQPAYAYAQPNEGMGSKVLKYGAGIGAAGLGAYAVSQIFDSGSESD